MIEFGSSLLEHRLVAILRSVPDDRLEPVADALAESGVRLVEIALSDASALGQIESLRSFLPADVQVGAGTVTSVELAEAAVASGATFLVTPHVADDVVRFAVRRSLGLLCGVMTPTEAMRARELGARFLKLFPAVSLGPEYVRQLLGPFPDLELFPTGGISSGNLSAFLEAGAVGAGVGGALSKGTPEEIRAEASRLHKILRHRPDLELL